MFQKTRQMKELLRNNKRAILISIAILVALAMINQVTFYISLGVMAIIHILRKSTLKEWGLDRPKSWFRVILKSLALTILMLVIAVAMELIIVQFIQQPTDTSRFDIIKQNIWMLLGALIAVWFSAAFGEEIIWRGYIMKYVAQFMGDNKKAWIFSLVITSVLFGALHYYQGPAGMIKTGVAGLFLGTVYILNGKQNLWLNILIHGFVDTISLVTIFLQANQ